MPTVLRVPGYRVAIFPHDHRPAHVHVASPQGSCVLKLNCPDGPLELRELYELAEQQVMRLARVLEPEIKLLCMAWWRIHGFH
ncbi:DUF4160 domain-containing protein [Paraburkholderia unamae]|uniref:Uncharacterized protein DUF4160 n=1 Tax=Paraburkholderia unamae TaxID=219649 RepID=A0ABX5KK02_9BURK|nr:DUF4160 domain-containing protein [Paraburkholderia unamae]PVX82192.1 uncharacterized protein DUF4160 [Paraburkholderia unamae]CAG9272397.1 conserved hypothetical protein [Paraburkholderia unamae]